MSMRGPGGAGAQSGDAEGMVVRFNNATSVKIDAGFYKAGTILYKLLADTTHAMTSLVVGFDNHYIYIDASLSTAAAPVFYDTTDEGVYDPVKRGRYSGNDVQIGVVTSHAGAATILYFDTVEMSGKLIRNFTVRYEFASAQNPDGTWQTPGVSDADIYTPVNAVELLVHLRINRVGASAFALWSNNEYAAVVTDYIQSPNYTRGGANVEDNSWGALGATRKIKIAGVDEGNNDFGAWGFAYGYRR